MTRLLIVGCKGRMGRALLACAAEHAEVEVSGQVDLGDDLEEVIGGCDAVIEFSFHEATLGVARACLAHSKPLVIGTTGHAPAEREQILQISQSLPMVWASNYSTGVNVLFWLTRKAAETLGTSFDLEVVEMHHRLKTDAPSGTAMSLAKILAEVRQLETEQSFRYGRQGLVGERPSTEIGLHALRGGDVVGDHTVIFAAPGERVELTHRASSRETFANGALRAACWVRHQGPGLYDMEHVLGLR